MRKCAVIIYWSREDDAFIAEVPELPGCAAIDLWIRTATEFGDPIPEPKGRRLILA